MNRKMFSLIYEQKSEVIKKMVELEKELQSYNIDSFYEGDELFDSDLAKHLGLDVVYLDPNDLPDYVEAILAPTDNSDFFGVVKISKTQKTRFPYMHEIIHYLRDVGVGNRVTCVYTRKVKGKTDSEKEQEINYLTAAAVMPIKIVKSDVKKFEEIETNNEKEFLNELVKKYHQNVDAVVRRLMEVRSLLDYGFVL